MKIQEVLPDHYLRQSSERLIRATYALSYGARVKDLPHTLIVLSDKNDKVHAAAGLRDSSRKYLSEYYLDDKIEAVIGGLTGRPVDRNKIVEVSSLASRTPAISVAFMRGLVLYIEELEFDWAFFTATARLENLLLRMRLPLITLGKACASRIPNPEIWGSYYDADPRVVCLGREQLLPFLTKQRSRAGAGEVRAHG